MKTLIINNIMFQLIKQGWHPKIEGISRYIRNDDDILCGGEELIITCDFTQ